MILKIPKDELDRMVKIWIIIDKMIDKNEMIDFDTWKKLELDELYSMLYSWESLN